MAKNLNHYTGLVSPQFQLTFDDHFTTVSSLRRCTTPANWVDLCHDQAVHVARRDTNDSLLFSFDDSITSENEGNMPDLIVEDETSISSMPPNERGASVHKVFVNLDRVAHRRSDRVRSNQQESTKTHPSLESLAHKLSDHIAFMSSVQSNKTHTLKEVQQQPDFKQFVKAT